MFLLFPAIWLAKFSREMFILLKADGQCFFCFLFSFLQLVDSWLVHRCYVSCISEHLTWNYTRGNQRLIITFNIKGSHGTLDSGSRDPGSSAGRSHCVVFLGKTLDSHSASLHTGINGYRQSFTATWKNAGGNLRWTSILFRERSNTPKCLVL